MTDPSGLCDDFDCGGESCEANGESQTLANAANYGRPKKNDH